MSTPTIGPACIAAPVQLEVLQAVCRFGQHSVVDRVDLLIPPGQHVALIGGNGSGKTTLLRAMLGLHQLAAGQILLNGTPPA
ncbi:MAG: hypothetical protein Fur005_26080 [Roseiflexaceae bacterium]